uniref:Uncharacterized protein n=1 Tax=Cacopsylla melanoneura TaxID=428564 RepID=A0A8D9FBV6_9HEMI
MLICLPLLPMVTLRYSGQGICWRPPIYLPGNKNKKLQSCFNVIIAFFSLFYCLASFCSCLFFVVLTVCLSLLNLLCLSLLNLLCLSLPNLLCLSLPKLLTFLNSCLSLFSIQIMSII